MDDFLLKFMAATLYVMIGGAILVWALDKFAREMEQLSRATVEDFVGAMIAIGVITVVALLI
ncbi:hypothetical protein N9I79_02105 [Gammaproteobacteria bacterium]|nr:hypothetical protein [Gammaproteobacteria bacterium]